MAVCYFDLSHACTSGMPVYPGDPAVSVCEAASVAADGFRLHRLSLSSHAGTHMDAAAHVLADGEALSDIDCSRFAGRLCVIDCRLLGEGGCIAAECIERSLQDIELPQWVLFATGWDRFWNENKYFMGAHPVLTTEAIEFLTGLPLSGVGFDAPGPDAFGELERHRALFKSVPLVVENLTGLTALADCLQAHPGACARFFAFPLKLDCPDGAPVRAVAEVIF